jgi:hypothetical protein
MFFRMLDFVRIKHAKKYAKNFVSVCLEWLGGVYESETAAVSLGFAYLRLVSLAKSFILHLFCFISHCFASAHLAHPSMISMTMAGTSADIVLL